MADHLEISRDLLDYAGRVSLRDDDLLRELRQVTSGMPGGSTIQVPAEEGQLLGLLVGLCASRRVVEIGTFTGYSALCMARALPADGRLYTCDVTDRWSSVAVEFWKRAEVSDRIDARIGSGVDVLAELAAEIGTGSVDLVFVDADKRSYRAYYEWALRLLRPNGLVVVDNTLFFGRVIDPERSDPDTVAIRELNEFIRDDRRVDIALLPMADGVTLARKRGGPGG